VTRAEAGVFVIAVVHHVVRGGDGSRAGDEVRIVADDVMILVVVVVTEVADEDDLVVVHML